MLYEITFQNVGFTLDCVSLSNFCILFAVKSYSGFVSDISIGLFPSIWDGPLQKSTHPFECVQCGRNYKQKKKLNFHIKHDCGKAVQCSQCFETFNNRATLSAHVKHACGQVIICQKCFHVFRHKSSLVYHEKYVCQFTKTK